MVIVPSGRDPKVDGKKHHKANRRSFDADREDAKADTSSQRTRKGSLQ
jgi:hypothetical protein